MKNYILITIILLFFACKAKKDIQYVPIESNSQHIVVSLSKDTTVAFAKQRNEQLTIKKSRLETDLAFSDAEIDSTGLLKHSIENKGYIPAKVIIKIDHQRDTVTKVLHVKGDTIVIYEKGFLWISGLVSWILIIIFVAYKATKIIIGWHKNFI